jgi:hypothetical protein
MKFRGYLAAGIAVLAAGTVACWAAGSWSTLPIVGQPSFCISTVTGAGGFNTQGTAGGGGVTGQGQAASGSLCAQTVPAGPPFLTGNELIPADSGLQVPATVTIPSGVIAPRINALIGGDFGQNLWQRGTTPISAVNASAAFMSADGFYAFGNGTQITVAKQTAAADQPPGSAASLRLQRPNAQTGTGIVCVGQLVPDDSSGSLIGNTTAGGRTVVLGVDMLAGANMSATGTNVTLTIAYHSAADAAASANGQGTNTGTFASSIGTTQNITNYTEAVNSVQSVSTTWARYTASAVIPQLVPGTATAVAGVGVKICYTPVGTAGANDWIEIGKVQLESRNGQGVGPSPFEFRPLALDWQLQYARSWLITEATGNATPVYANGMVAGTNQEILAFNFPAAMRIVPSTTPITLGSFELNIAGTLTSPTAVSAPALGNTNFVGQLKSQTTATAGQAVQWTGGTLGTGRLGFSAEP